MERSINAIKLIKNMNSHRLWTVHIAILALIFATGKSTNILTAQKMMILTSLWSISLVGTITVRSRVFNLIITNNQYYKPDQGNSTWLIRALDVLFFLIVIRGMGGFMLKMFSKVEIKNTHLIPKDGAVILAPNHSSYIDSLILQTTFPRRITFMIFERHYKTWGKWYYKSQHSIPVREKGVNCNALKKGLELLKNDGALCIFPEGELTPDGNLQEGKHGIGFLAIKSKATIVPVYIAGAFEVLSAKSHFPRLFRKIEIIYGNPIYFNGEYTNEKVSRERLTNKIMDEVEKLSYLKDA